MRVQQVDFSDMVHRSQLTTPDGWTLGLRRWWGGGGAPRGHGQPVLFVPGYGMNAHIFGFHPEGPGFMEYLARRGFDPWAVDLRGQGDGRKTGLRRGRRIRLAEQALVDLPLVLDHISAVTGHRRVHAVGCSLGGALLYTLLAHRGDQHIGRMAAVASPLRWDARHPVVSTFGLLGPVLGRVPMRGTRPAARLGLPVLSRLTPRLLSIYLTAEKLDLSHSRELVRTVEDPDHHISRQLAAWIRSRDLVVEGVNVRQALAKVSTPLLLITASADGIVPPATAQSVLGAIGGETHHVHVGGPDDPWAHVDLFVGSGARQRVFRPVADWLAA